MVFLIIVLCGFFCEGSFDVKAPDSISQRLCPMELQDTLILSNTLVYKQGNWNKVIVKFMVELGLQPRSPEPVLQSSRIHLRQAKLPTLTAIV